VVDFDNVRWSDWPISACVAAIFAARALGVNFAGIDVMLDAEGRPYVLEANSAPSQTSPIPSVVFGQSVQMDVRER